MSQAAGGLPHVKAATNWTGCYSTDPGRRRAEIPEDDNNHALGDAAT